MRPLCKLFPVVLLSVVQVPGTITVVRSQTFEDPRSQVIAQQPSNQTQKINQFIQDLKSTDPEVRWQAASTLGRTGESAKVAVPELLITALKDPNELVRWHAAVALGQIGESKAAVPALIAALKDPDKDVRAYAAESLKTLGYQP